MRQAFLPTASRVEAKRQAPWAAVIIKVEGGFMAFESVKDAAIWRKQK